VLFPSEEGRAHSCFRTPPDRGRPLQQSRTARLRWDHASPSTGAMTCPHPPYCPLGWSSIELPASPCEETQSQEGPSERSTETAGKGRAPYSSRFHLGNVFGIARSSAGCKSRMRGQERILDAKKSYLAGTILEKDRLCTVHNRLPRLSTAIFTRLRSTGFLKRRH
jgi:hypothetical protein